MNNHDQLKSRVEQQARRIQKADRERPTLLAQTTYLGTLGLVFVLPVVAGAYLGRWLDARLAGFSVSWTTSLIITGVFIGAMNVYWLIREKE